jgi:hypothetical protein
MVASDVWVVVGSVAGVLVLVGTFWLVVLEVRKGRGERERRAEDKAAADARAQAQVFAAAEAELVGKTWILQHRLRVPVGETVPSEPPVEISIKGANVWVHEVRLTWRPSEPAIAYWITKDAPCPPWGDGSLPYHLNAGSRPLQLGWPGPTPEQQAQIMQKVKVTYSALRDGPQHERETDGGSVGWQ